MDATIYVVINTIIRIDPCWKKSINLSMLAGDISGWSLDSTAICGWTLNCFACNQDGFSHLPPNSHVVSESIVSMPFVVRLFDPLDCEGSPNPNEHAAFRSPVSQ